MGAPFTKQHRYTPLFPLGNDERVPLQIVLTHSSLPWQRVCLLMDEEEPLTVLDKKIIEAFMVFDHTSSNTVDVREVGTIIRSLGCCPSEAEIQEILVAAEDEETSGGVKLDRFLSTVSHIIQEKRLQPASPEKLLKAFLALDRDRKGYLTKEFLGKIMMEEGEPFTQEELDEMMAAAIDGETGNIPYEYYINQLMVNPTDDNLIPQPKGISRKEHSNH